jgi:O-methyltransferase domain/Dimerisation domain
MTDVTPERIFQLATGFMAAKHLFIASEVGLFAALADGPAPLGAIAEATGIARSRIRVLADAMVAVGLLERDGDAYRNGPVAATFLGGKGQADLRPFLRFWNHVSYPLWTKLEDTVRTGRGQQGIALPEEQERIYLEGVEALMAGPAAALAAGYDFGRHRRLLDLGGGIGAWTIAILRAHPALEGTLFDMPEGADLARRRLGRDPAGHRATVVGGNFFTDPIPSGHDVVLVANVVHLYGPARNRELLQRVRAAVPDGARLLLADWWTNPAHTEPALAAMMAGEFLLFSGEGDVYSEEEARAWLNEAGWRPLNRQPLAGALSVLIAETA